VDLTRKIHILRYFYKTITFSTLSISRAPYFFQKCPWEFWILKSELVFSFVVGWKKKSFSPIQILKSELVFSFVVGWKNPKISINRVRYLIFSDYRIQTPPKHPFSWCRCSSDYIIQTAPAPILKMFVTCILIFRTILIFLTLILVFLLSRPP